METGSRRRYRTKEERLRIVEETLAGGISVAQVARKHDVNANQVFQWRTLYRTGRLESGAPKGGALLPVRIAEDAAEVRRPRMERPGIIDIDLGHARVRIEGAADPASIRAALEGLQR